ncbi:ComF family protein [Gayadomonas joobiniege]|uniref:ComF family protein n=1 Tax=Gayadomonas joobiniege TaxID=1234606 RepID=UPI00036A976E|nr:phosphoribosyltransferase family protein [Gayadomonas joobiniege]
MILIKRLVSPILTQAKQLVPRLCLFCDGPLAEQNSVCHYCLNDWRKHSECLAWADILSMPGVKKTLNASALAHIYCLNQHQQQVAALIRRFKYQQDLLAGSALIELMAYCHQEAFENAIFIPVPMHWLRRLYRGFNQANWLAEQLAKQYQGQCLPLLKRTRYTQRQAGLEALQRRKNLQDAFVLNKAAFVSMQWPKPVFLVDDVVTTGTTLNTLAQVLKAAGIEHVNAVTISWSAAASVSRGY